MVVKCLLSRIRGRDCSSTRCQKGSLHRLGTRKAGTLEQGLRADNESEEKGTKEPSPSAAQNCGEATVLVTRGSEPPSAAGPMLVSQATAPEQHKHQLSLLSPYKCKAFVVFVGQRPNTDVHAAV